MSDPQIDLAVDSQDKPVSRSTSELSDTNWCLVGKPGQMKSVLVGSWQSQYVALPKHSTIVIDLGGDKALYQSLARVAVKVGKPVYTVSLDENHDNCGWEPILNTPSYAYNRQHMVAGIQCGLRLQHGDGYPTTFWSRKAAAEINKAFDSLRHAGCLLPSFPQFANELRINAEADRGKQISEAHLAADELLRYRFLYEDNRRQLFLSKAIEESALVYFYLPTALDGGAARSLAALASWSTTVEAALRENEGKDDRTIHLVIDEYSQIASEKSTVEATLNLARKWNVQMTLVLQSFNQVPEDLRGVIRTNCQLAIFDAYSKEEQEWLMRQSLEVNRPQQSTNESEFGFQSSLSSRDNWESELTHNRILEVSGQKQKFFLLLKLGQGHQNPIECTVRPAVSKEEHAELKKLPMPTRPKQIRTPMTKVASRVQFDPRHKKHVAELKKLMAKILQEETW